MNQRFHRLLCLASAGALALGLTACSFFTGEDGAQSSAVSSELTSGVVSRYGAVSSFDYETFTYSDGLDENGYWDGVRALDYVTLPEDYAAIPVERAALEPTAEEIQTQIDGLLSQNTTTREVTDRAAADGDTVNIDYSGRVDGVLFTGGTAEGYDLTLGSGLFIDDFEEQIVGHTPGETFDVEVTFPDGYNDSTDTEGNTVVLSGADAVFTVTLNYISESVTPELTDEWVDATYGESDGVHTVLELQEMFRELLFQDNLNSAVMDYLLENSTFKEIPTAISDYQIKQCLLYYYTYSNYFGYTMDEFIQNFIGYTDADALLASMDEDIETYSKEALLYQAVAEALEITPTQEQIDAYAAYEGAYGTNYCRMLALMEAVTDTLAAGASVV